MPYCIHCGVANVHGAVFCKSCGTASNVPIIMMPAVPAAPVMPTIIFVRLRCRKLLIGILGLRSSSTPTESAHRCCTVIRPRWL